MRYLILLLFTLRLAADPVVHGILFYSDNCKHCHVVIEEQMPPILAEYGSKLDIDLINVSTRYGHKVFESALAYVGLPIQRAGVPALLIDRKLLLGSIQIPKELPGLVDQLLAQGGAPLPPLAGMNEETHEKLRPQTHLHERSLAQKFSSDPVGITVAIVILLVMVLTAILVAISWFKRGIPKRQSAFIPILAFVGLSIALYLSYLELTGSEGICGPIGNCNGVQQSPYSHIFGVPVGVLGAIGYFIILALHFWQPFTWILPLFVYFGTLFSIYLTFLEPFVIGAICLWCLLSACIITILLWIHYPKKNTTSVS